MANVLDMWGLRVVFFMCSAVAFIGAAITVLFIDETLGKSLEQINPPETSQPTSYGSLPAADVEFPKFWQKYVSSPILRQNYWPWKS